MPSNRLAFLLRRCATVLPFASSPFLACAPSLLYALKSGAEQATSIFFVTAVHTQMRAYTYPHLQDIPSFSPFSHIHTLSLSFCLSLSYVLPLRDLQITIKILNACLFFSFLFYQAQLLGSEAVFFVLP